MNPERVDQLEKYLIADPSDPFVLYALAMEWSGTDSNRAKDYFDRLLEQHETYLPTYYHAAQLYIRMENPSRAEQLFQRGIELAKKQRDQHTLAELQNAYTNFLYE